VLGKRGACVSRPACTEELLLGVQQCLVAREECRAWARAVVLPPSPASIGSEATPSAASVVVTANHYPPSLPMGDVPVAATSEEAAATVLTKVRINFLLLHQPVTSAE
jgi:hypothetical protein